MRKHVFGKLQMAIFAELDRADNAPATTRELASRLGVPMPEVLAACTRLTDRGWLTHSDSGWQVIVEDDAVNQ